MILKDSILVSHLGYILGISCINKYYLAKHFKIIFMDTSECEALLNYVTKNEEDHAA